MPDIVLCSKSSFSMCLLCSHFPSCHRQRDLELQDNFFGTAQDYSLLYDASEGKEPTHIAAGTVKVCDNIYLMHCEHVRYHISQAL